MANWVKTCQNPVFIFCFSGFHSKIDKIAGVMDDNEHPSEIYGILGFDPSSGSV